ncbi:MAG: tetratricopeptide repeat protein [Prevotella sp.]|nr:tetratricopeptide repeat protein [Prevotella sp.]
MTSEEFYLEGNKHRKRGDFAAAMNSYAEAIKLDKNSPAVEARKMLENIMDFYCKDLYNP